ncbi:MAG TPA: VacJ family lipoprotein, partial [Casimicrobiaceae bacterium]|nr:VacJ family lipoprotein [Casimicrobiaceae bacterium]
MSIRAMRRNAFAMSLALFVAACATTMTPTSAVDPLEPLNRAAFRFNEPLDRDIIKPMVRAYLELPRGVRYPVTSFFNNIEDFFSAVNGMLQGKPDKAGHDAGRVIVNSFFGLGGLIDFASEAGIPRGEEDFGQTFAVWGAPAGPYLFIPLFGPSTGRDATGFVVRYFLSPIPQIESEALQWSLTGLGYVEARSQALEAQSLAEGASLDP